jgi:hypothetical protein
MELYWESFNKEENCVESCGILAPGIWLTLRNYVSSDNIYRCRMTIHNLANQTELFETCTVHENEHEKNVAKCEKYASIIAGSFFRTAASIQGLSQKFLNKER